MCAVLVVAGAGAPESADAGHPGKRCGIVSKGPRDYKVTANKLKCKKARKGTKKYLRKKKGLKGFSCAEPAGPIVFFCKRGTQVYSAELL